MPRAVVSIETAHFDLESCPPDGFVELKRMSYSEWLHRTDISMQMQIEMEDSVKRKKGKDSKGSIQLMNEAVTTFEFSKCIVGHNLEDAEGKLLNFSNPSGLRILDPRIGSEIGELIKSMHEFTNNEDEQGN